MFAIFFILTILTAFCVAHEEPETASDIASTAFSALFSGKTEEARTLFQTLRQDENPYVQNWGVLGIAKTLMEEGQFDEAEKLLNGIGKPKESLIVAEFVYEWFYTKGDLAFRQGKYEEAIEWLKQAAPATCKPKVCYLMASAYLKKADQAKEPSEKKEAFANADHYFLELLQEIPPSDIANYYYKKANITHDSSLFLKAAEYYESALQNHDVPDLHRSLYAALTKEGSLSSLEKAEAILLKLEKNPYERALMQAELLVKKNKKQEALLLLEKEAYPEPFLEKQLITIGFLAYDQKEYQKAISAFQKYLQVFPDSPSVPDALFWTAMSEEALFHPQEIFRPHYKTIYEKYPLHPLADDAYFKSYSEQDYLLGGRAAMKHLRDFQKRFPDSPLLLHAAYLEGLDALHDRKTPEGKWICKKNLIAAIDAFQRVEMLFDTLSAKQDLSEFIPLRYQAILDRAKTNWKIASESVGAKKTIYLDYAEEVFTSLISAFHTLNEENRRLLAPLLEESLYYLAVTEFESGKKEEALAHLDTLILNQKQDSGYFLALALYQKGLHSSGTQAIVFFEQAEKAGAPRILSTEEFLNIGIAKAAAYRNAGDLDLAMLQLSEVVNSETASSLRIKAMYLRAEIYAEQGRKALAQKQLESIALKGGEWAQKAKEQLEKYEYQ